MHANAQKAAEASHCAEAQGKYWEYHDTLAAAKRLELSALKNYARELRLDTAAFDKCLDSGEKAGVVKEESSEAQALGIQGTPTFFLNGRFVNGNVTYERLRGIIGEELSATGDPARAPAANGSSRERPRVR
jgi:protein-disulfide isomerase